MIRASALVVVFLASALLAQPAANVPTIEQLQQQLDSNPQEVIRGVQRLLAMKGPAAEQLDRYELLMLRGEASLRTKAMPAAAQAFEQAAKETIDPMKQQAARANEILVRRSKQSGFIPKPQPGAGGRTPEPMPIINDEDRKAAMNVLLTEALATLTPRVKAATEATNLNPIIEVAKVLGELNAVEMYATGANTQTKQIGSAVGTQAHRLIADALSKMKARTEDIWRQGSREQYTVDQYGTRERSLGMMGLTSVERKDLKDIIATVEKLEPVAKDLAAVTGAAELQADAAEATRLRERAHEVDAYDYGGGGRNPRQTQTRQGTQVPGQSPPGQQPPRQQPPRAPGTR